MIADEPRFFAHLRHSAMSNFSALARVSSGDGISRQRHSCPLLFPISKVYAYRLKPAHAGQGACDMMACFGAAARARDEGVSPPTQTPP